MTPENLLTEWARVLFESLADAGLRDVVVSPGSRSTPLAWAALACPRLRPRSVIDERSAGFFALGQGKVTGVPTALLCTSGSAAANYFPAVVEAASSRTPLLVITADRPFELLDCGASQTLDQTKMYGEFVRRFVELGMPDAGRGALVALRRRAAQTLLDCVSPEPGPVHVNFRATKPLEPVTGQSEGALVLTTRVDELLRTPITRPAAFRRAPVDDAIEAVAASCRGQGRGVIVCGPVSPGTPRLAAGLAELSRASGYPVYAETTSQLRLGATPGLAPDHRLDGLDLLLRSAAFRAEFRPDVIIQVGAPPTSGAWDRFIAEHPETARHVLCAHGWPDPQGTARTLIVADLDEALSLLAAALAAGPGAGAAPGGAAPLPPGTRARGGWVAWLARANAAAWSAVDALLVGDATLSEGAAVRAVVSALPPSSLLAVGNSLPVRHVDAFCRGGGATDVRVWSQRGVAGIDGVVSGAAGAADAAERPTVLIVGDVSALHDLGGFAAAATVGVPFVVVVLNNDGGRIFEQLPLASAGVDETRLAFWTTPHGRHFDALAGLFGLEYVAARSLPELHAALGRGLTHAGCSLVEVIVPPHGAREQHRELALRVDAAVRALGEAPDGP